MLLCKVGVILIWWCSGTLTPSSMLGVHSYCLYCGIRQWQGSNLGLQHALSPLNSLSSPVCFKWTRHRVIDFCSTFAHPGPKHRQLTAAGKGRLCFWLMVADSAGALFCFHVIHHLSTLCTFSSWLLKLVTSSETGDLCRRRIWEHQKHIQMSWDSQRPQLGLWEWWDQTCWAQTFPRAGPGSSTFYELVCVSQLPQGSCMQLECVHGGGYNRKFESRECF